MTRHLLLALLFSTPALAQLQFEGLDLGDDAASETPAKPVSDKPPEVKKKKDEGPAAPLKFEALDVEAKTADREKFDAAVKAMDDGDWEIASVAFQQLIATPSAATFHEEALYRLGKCLYKLKLYHSALRRFDKILAKGEEGKRFKVALEWVLFIGRKVKDASGVLSIVARYATTEFPEKYKGEFHYLLGKYHYARGEALIRAEQPDEAKKSFAEARRLTMLVPPEDRKWPKSKFLEGLVLYQQGIDDLALEAFKDVVRSTNPKTGKFKKQKRLREQAFLQLARIHYGHRQNRNSIFYYSKMKRLTARWLRSLFESGWAHYRIGDYERALGNLITLNAPFYEEEYFPEALILQAVIYYENCRYAEARTILDDFEKTYQPVHDELVRITGQPGEATVFYDYLSDVQKKIKAGQQLENRYLNRILKLALTDAELDRLNDAILEIENEQDGVGEQKELFRYSPLAKELLEDLKSERQERLLDAGRVAKTKLSLELAELKKLLGNALRIKYETTSREKELLEGLLSDEARPEELKTYHHSVAVADDEHYWPYEGEFWRDELGTYQYTLSRGCKKR